MDYFVVYEIKIIHTLFLKNTTQELYTKFDKNV